MKKIFTIVASLLLAIGISYAKDESKFGAGIKASISYDQIFGFEEDIDGMDGNPSGIGFDAGIMLRVLLSTNVYLAPEVNISYANTNHKVDKKERTYDATDLEIPVMFRAVIANKFYVTAGPQFVLNMANDSDIPSAVDNTGMGIDLSKYGESTEQTFFTMGIAAGAGYNIIGGLNVDFRFYMGLMELFPDVKTVDQHLKDVLTGKGKADEPWTMFY